MKISDSIQSEVTFHRNDTIDNKHPLMQRRLLIETKLPPRLQQTQCHDPLVSSVLNSPNFKVMTTCGCHERTLWCMSRFLALDFDVMMTENTPKVAFEGRGMVLAIGQFHHNLLSL